MQYCVFDGVDAILTAWFMHCVRSAMALTYAAACLWLYCNAVKKCRERNIFINQFIQMCNEM